MRKDLHNQVDQLVTQTCASFAHTGKGLRAALRRVNPFSYKTDPYWYRIFLKYRHREIERMYEAQAAKQMKLFEDNK